MCNWVEYQNLNQILVFNSAFGRQRHWLIPMTSYWFIIIFMSFIIYQFTGKSSNFHVVQVGSYKKVLVSLTLGPITYKTSTTIWNGKINGGIKLFHRCKYRSLTFLMLISKTVVNLLWNIISFWVDLDFYSMLTYTITLTLEDLVISKPMILRFWNLRFWDF